MIRMDRTAIRLDDDAQRDLLDLFEDERRAAEASQQGEMWLAILLKAKELTAARIEAAMWHRAARTVRP